MVARREASLAFAWLLGLATGGCNSCCNDSHQSWAVGVTDDQIARGFPPAVCRALCGASRMGLDAAALDATDRDAGGNEYDEYGFTCALSGHQLACDELDHCPPQ